MSFYIKSPSGGVFEMDATVSVGYSQTGAVTEYAVASKRKSSDHYEQNPDTVRFSGFVSKVKFARRRNTSLEVVGTLEAFEQGLQNLKRSGEFFSCSFSENLPILKNCLFTSLEIQRSSELGYHCIQLDFNIKQVIISTQADLKETPIPASAYADLTEESEKGNSSSVESSSSENLKLGDTVRELSPSIADATGF